MKCGCCGKESHAEICDPYCIPCGLHIEGLLEEVRKMVGSMDFHADEEGIVRVRREALLAKLKEMEANGG